MTYLDYDVLVPRLRANLAAEGFKLTLYPGSRTMCRCCSGNHRTKGPFIRGWNPGGVGVHITGGGLGGRSFRSYNRDILVSDPSLPLKSQFATAPNGDVEILSVGRCNHLGGIGARAAEMIRTGSFRLDDPWDDRGRGGGTDGNSRSWGIENIAAHTMTLAQRRASVIICATLAQLSGEDWNAGEDHAHGEVSNQRGKADPNLDMGRFRRDVRVLTARYREGGTAPAPTPTPAPQPEELDTIMKHVLSTTYDVDQKLRPRSHDSLRVAKDQFALRREDGSVLKGPDVSILLAFQIGVTGLGAGDSVDLDVVAYNPKTKQQVPLGSQQVVGGKGPGWDKGQVTAFDLLGKDFEPRVLVRNALAYSPSVAYLTVRGRHS